MMTGSLKNDQELDLEEVQNFIKERESNRDENFSFKKENERSENENVFEDVLGHTLHEKAENNTFKEES